MKRRRIEITVSRRTTTIELRDKAEAAETSVYQVVASPPVAAGLLPEAQLPGIPLALTTSTTETGLSEVQPEAVPGLAAENETGSFR